MPHTGADIPESHFRLRPRQAVAAVALAVAGATLAVPALLERPDQDAATPGPAAQRVSAAAGQPSATSSPKVRPTSAPEPTEEAAPRRHPGVPRRIALPALGVDAKVVPVTAREGTLVPPDDPQQLGWWSEGVKPGSTEGRALLTGHTLHAGGGALDDLEDLAAGDRVVVGTDRGRLEYAVESVRYLTIEQVAEQAARLFRATGPERLVIVTCEGWDGTDYEGNTIVVATPVA